MHAAFLSRMAASPVNYSWVHYCDPDVAGHDDGWGSAAWDGAIRNVDGYLGGIFDLIANESALNGKTAIILTADHGGTGNNPRRPDRPGQLHDSVLRVGPRRRSGRGSVRAERRDAPRPRSGTARLRRGRAADPKRRQRESRAPAARPGPHPRLHHQRESGPRGHPSSISRDSKTTSPQSNPPAGSARTMAVITAGSTPVPATAAPCRRAVRSENEDPLPAAPRGRGAEAVPAGTTTNGRSLRGAPCVGAGGGPPRAESVFLRRSSSAPRPAVQSRPWRWSAPTCPGRPKCCASGTSTSPAATRSSSGSARWTAATRRVLLVGHNPGIGRLAHGLVRAECRRRLRAPPARIPRRRPRGVDVRRGPLVRHRAPARPPRRVHDSDAARLHSMRAGRTTSVQRSVNTNPITSTVPRLAMPRWEEKASAPKLATVVAAL